MTTEEMKAVEAMQAEWWRGDRLTLAALADAAEEQGCPHMAEAWREIIKGYCPLVDAYHEAMAWCLENTRDRHYSDNLNKEIPLSDGRLIRFSAYRFVRTIRGGIVVRASAPSSIAPGVWLAARLHPKAYKRCFKTEITPKGELARLKFLGEVYTYERGSQ